MEHCTILCFGFCQPKKTNEIKISRYRRHHQASALGGCSRSSQDNMMVTDGFKPQGKSKSNWPKPPTPRLPQRLPNPTQID
jgi:hypothetical protein